MHRRVGRGGGLDDRWQARSDCGDGLACAARSRRPAAAAGKTWPDARRACCVLALGSIRCWAHAWHGEIAQAMPCMTEGTLPETRNVRPAYRPTHVIAPGRTHNEPSHTMPF
ncbi:hypothetical protein BVI2075_1450004 [Burkholderia vietnamiensis]|nr:hypothetical protein BVI2075_1450004 [Burkholderia vietnamiensis]